MDGCLCYYSVGIRLLVVAAGLSYVHTLVRKAQLCGRAGRAADSGTTTACATTQLGSHQRSSRSVHLVHCVHAARTYFTGLGSTELRIRKSKGPNLLVLQWDLICTWDPVAYPWVNQKEPCCRQVFKNVNDFNTHRLKAHCE